MAEMKPCPFCGSKSVRLAENTLEGHFIGYSVHCNGCGVENRYTKDKEEAVNAWNTRYLIEYNVEIKDRLIPCSERLPENDANCLVYTSDKRIRIARCYGKYDKQGAWYIISEQLYSIKNVLFWMPLPEPYKGEE